MPKRKCTFNEKLQSEYMFLKKNVKNQNKSKIFVWSSIRIEHDGGKSDITQHLKTERHNIAASASKTQKVFLQSSRYINYTYSLYISMPPITQFADKEQKLVADEGIFAYHICRHNHSLILWIVLLS